jgi:hypothetical protein
VCINIDTNPGPWGYNGQTPLIDTLSPYHPRGFECPGKKKYGKAKERTKNRKEVIKNARTHEAKYTESKG